MCSDYKGRRSLGETWSLSCWPPHHQTPGPPHTYHPVRAQELLSGLWHPQAAILSLSSSGTHSSLKFCGTPNIYIYILGFSPIWQNNYNKKYHFGSFTWFSSGVGYCHVFYLTMQGKRGQCPWLSSQVSRVLQILGHSPENPWKGHFPPHIHSKVP